MKQTFNYILSALGIYGVLVIAISIIAEVYNYDSLMVKILVIF